MPTHDDPPPPSGLLGLILWPLQAGIVWGLGLFTLLLQGIFGALLPPSSTTEDPPKDPPADPTS